MERAADRPPGTAGLLIGILGPALVWAVRFGVVYVLIPYVCAGDDMWVLHAITALSLLLVAGLTLLSWRRWRSARRGGGEVGERVRFMTLAGVMSGAFFLAVIVAEGLANGFIHPCQQAGIPIA